MRILDFPHAVGHLGDVAQAVFGPGTPVASEWLGQQQAHTLRHADPALVLTTLAELADTVRAGSQPTHHPDAVRIVEGCLHYFSRRIAQLRYRDFVALGYPIGSGSVESANKVLVEARLKGNGMRWCRDNVNRMLVLRCLTRNGRWAEAWPSIWAGLRRRHVPPARPTTTSPARPAPSAGTLPPPDLSPRPARPTLVVNGKPTPDHPWRRSALY